MTKAKSKEDKVIIARTHLKRCIRIERRGGKSVFIIPEQLAETLLKNYKFSFEQLCVGGEIDLQDLAVHMDGQGQLEAEAGIVSEQARLIRDTMTIEYEAWYEMQCAKIRKWFYGKYDKWPTEAYVKGKLASGKCGKENVKRRIALADLEADYRILNNVIRSAIIVKGDMLRSMRPLLQSDGNSVGSINVKVAHKVRTKLIVQKESSNGKEEKEKRQKSSKRVKTKGRKGKEKA